MISKTSHPNGYPVLSALSFYLCSTTVCGHQNFCKATAVTGFPGGICGDPAKALPQSDTTGQGSGLTSPASTCMSQPHWLLVPALYFLVDT